MISLRVASVLLWISTIGLGIPCVMAIYNLSRGRGIPFVMGFPAYGGEDSNVMACSLQFLY